MTDETFKLRYVGTRFNNARFPVDVLSDLPAFRDLLVAFAKEEWRRLNSERQRVPKGFDKSLSFDLIGIEEGSAVPALSWNSSNAQQLLPGFTDDLQHIIRQSYRSITGLIDAASVDQFPRSLSAEHVRALNRLGTGLREGERIEFLGASGSSGNVVYLDTERRKKLITHVRETYQARFESVGKLVSNSVDGFVTVRTQEHDNIHIPLDSEQVKEEFDGSLESDVQFDLQVELDNDDRLRRVVSVYDIGLIDAEIGSELIRCQTRLDSFGSLSSGWHDGKGNSISTEALSAAKRLLSKRPSLSARYRIYPTELGGVLFEFEANDWDLSVEFDVGGTVEMYGVRLSNDEVLEPVVHETLDEAFMNEFDKYVGR